MAGFHTLLVWTTLFTGSLAQYYPSQSQASGGNGQNANPSVWNSLPWYRPMLISSAQRLSPSQAKFYPELSGGANGNTFMGTPTVARGDPSVSRPAPPAFQTQMGAGSFGGTSGRPTPPSAAAIFARRRALAAKMQRERMLKEQQRLQTTPKPPLAQIGDTLISYINGQGPHASSQSRVNNAVLNGCASAFDATEMPLASLFMPGGCDPKNDMCPFTHRGRRCVEVNKGYGMCCPSTVSTGTLDLQQSVQRMNTLMEMFGA